MEKKMKITVAENCPYDGYSIVEYDTDTMTEEAKDVLAAGLVHGTVELITISLLTPDTLGDDMMSAVNRCKDKLEAECKKRSAASKKGWETRRKKSAKKSKKNARPGFHDLDQDFGDDCRKHVCDRLKGLIISKRSKQ